MKRVTSSNDELMTTETVPGVLTGIVDIGLMPTPALAVHPGQTH
jgi:hypothetical protein